MNNRVFILGSFLLNAYSAISLICIPLLIFMGDDSLSYIPVHFCITLLVLLFFVYWRSVYVKEELEESASVASVYKWTTCGFIFTVILYTLIYLLFAALLFLMSGPPADY